MKKMEGSFVCPVCDCRYRHNWRAWVVGIPVAVAVAILVFQMIHIHTVATFAGVIVGMMIVGGMGLYRLTAEGKKDVTVGSVQAHVPEKKESRWAIVFMGLLLAVIAVVVYLSL
jgi:membrane-associated HD superfamily phosphohydrolase